MLSYSQEEEIISEELLKIFSRPGKRTGFLTRKGIGRNQRNKEKEVQTNHLVQLKIYKAKY